MSPIMITRIWITGTHTTADLGHKAMRVLFSLTGNVPRQV
jgi:hypothetical protein